MVQLEYFVRPTRAQTDRLLRLATLRKIADLPATRGERVAAMKRLLDGITKREADALIFALKDAPLASRNEERTPRFRERHDAAAGIAPDDVEWYRVPRTPVTPTADDKAWAEGLINPGKRQRETAAEIEAWAAARETQADETWGDVLVGSWD